jgi:hypothetical protein
MGFWPTNPNFVVPTPPLGDSSNRAASTAFVKGLTTGINVKQYGAAGDGTTDDTAAIQAAINAVGSAGGGIVVIPAGTFVCDGLTVSNSNVHIIGSGRGATVLAKKNATGDLFQIGNVRQVSISALSIAPNSGVTITAGACINFNTSGAIYCDIFDIYTLNMWDFLICSMTGVSNQIHNITAKQIRCDGHQRFGAWFQGTIDPFIDDFQVFGSSHSQGACIVYDSYCDGLLVSKALSTACQYGFRAQDTQAGNAPRGLEAVDCIFDNAGTACWSLGNLHYAKLKTPYAATQQVAAMGMVLGSDVYDLDMTNPRIVFCARSGIQNNGATDVSVMGGSIIACSEETTNTYDAVVLGGTVSGFRIIGTKIGPDPTAALSGTPKNGLTVNTGATRVIAVGCDFKGCNAAAINDGTGGAGIKYTNCWGISGSLLAGGTA